MGQDRVGGMRVQIDNAALLAALPLAPGAQVTIPILLHAAQVCPRLAALTAPSRQSTKLSEDNLKVPLICRFCGKQSDQGGDCSL